LALHIGLDCRKCSEYAKKENGCTEDSPIPGKWKIAEQTFNRCPVKLSSDDSKMCLVAYRLWKENKLPNGNGWINETNKFIESMFVIDEQLTEMKNGR